MILVDEFNVCPELCYHLKLVVGVGAVEQANKVLDGLPTEGVKVLRH